MFAKGFRSCTKDELTEQHDRKDPYETRNGLQQVLSEMSKWMQNSSRYTVSLYLNTTKKRSNNNARENRDQMHACLHEVIDSELLITKKWGKRCTTSGGFRHVQHVRPYRGHQKKCAPTGQRLSDASTTFSDLWGTVLRHLKR